MPTQDPLRPVSPLVPRPPEKPMQPAPVRWLLLALAVVSLAMAIVGIFLPMLPTIPFLLLAAWAASLSSPRLSRWLDNSRLFGKQLDDWRQHGVVSRRAKFAAIIMMSASACTMVFVVRPIWVSLTAIAIMTGVGAWLWLRPEQPTW